MKVCRPQSSAEPGTAARKVKVEVRHKQGCQECRVSKHRPRGRQVLEKGQEKGTKELRTRSHSNEKITLR